WGETHLEFEGARLKTLQLAPVVGGETELGFKLQVRPQNKHVTRLLDAQNCEVKFSLRDATVAERNRRRQQDQPLQPAAAEGTTDARNADRRRRGRKSQAEATH